MGRMWITDFMAVTDNFLLSIFSQCSIALNRVTISRAAELYFYRSFFETILTYGSDAATWHLTNAFWYKGDVDLLPCDPTAGDAKTKFSSRDVTVLSRRKKSNYLFEFTQ